MLLWAIRCIYIQPVGILSSMYPPSDLLGLEGAGPQHVLQQVVLSIGAKLSEDRQGRSLYSLLYKL